MEQCSAEMPITLLSQQTSDLCVSYMQSVFVFVWWSSNIHVEFLEKDDDVSHSKLKTQGFIHLGRVDRDVCGGSIFFLFFFSSM